MKYGSWKYFEQFGNRPNKQRNWSTLSHSILVSLSCNTVGEIYRSFVSQEHQFKTRLQWDKFTYQLFRGDLESSQNTRHRPLAKVRNFSWLGIFTA